MTLKTCKYYLNFLHIYSHTQAYITNIYCYKYDENLVSKYYLLAGFLLHVPPPANNGIIVRFVI